MMRFICGLLLGLSVWGGKSWAAPVPGDQLPPMMLVSAAGGTRPVWQRGQITIVSFCAFWCDTWKEQNKRMNESKGALRGLPVAWTMVSVDGRWADKSGRSPGVIARESRLDAGGHWTNRLAIRSVPTTLVVDGRGQVRFAGQGIARSQTLLSVVRTILNDSASLTTPTAKVVVAPSHPVRLVFDDFPSRNARLDDRLLDILRAAHLKATFCGDQERRRSSPALARRALDEGHQLKAAFGTPSKGTVDPFDWKRPGRDELLRRVLWGASPGKTLLLHAGVRETVDALPQILQSLRSRGLL